MYIPDLYGLAHATGWEPCNVHDLSQVSRVAYVLQYTHPAQHLTPASCDLDDLPQYISFLSYVSKHAAVSGAGCL